MDNIDKKIRIIQLVLFVLVIIMSVVIISSYKDINFPDEVSTTFAYDKKGQVIEEETSVVIEQAFTPDEAQTRMLQSIALSYYKVLLKSYDLSIEFEACQNPFDKMKGGELYWYYSLWEENNDIPVKGESEKYTAKLVDYAIFNRMLEAGKLASVTDVTQLGEYYDANTNEVLVSYGNESEGWDDYANIISAIQYKEDLIIVQLEVGVNQVTYDADANPTDNITPIYNVVLKVRQNPESVLGGFVVESVEYTPL